MRDNKFDVIIVGGSYSGLSAAMALGRSLRKVLVIDSGLPCNRQTPYSHNFLTQDGEKPEAIAQKGLTQVLEYNSITLVKDLALSGRKDGEGFVIITEQGKTFISKKLIFATGVKDLMPDISGFAQCWGISVIHCPYCHGYEYRSKKTAIIANGERAVHIASLVSNLTEDVTILTSGKADFEEAQLAKFSKHNIEIIETEISEIDHKDGYIANVIFSNDSKMSFDVAYAAIPFTQHSDIPESLGCKLTDMGHIEVDMFQRTTVDGIYACGDNTSMIRSVAYSVSTGNKAGVMANNDLTEEEF